MDSGTHLVMGLGLAGLACVDPVIASNQTIFFAAMLGTIAGSLAPDLDSLLRLKSNAAYIRNHRGLSHSFPAVLLWTLLITGALQVGFRGSLPWLQIGGWVLLAVALHVFTDLLNTYGTQALWPFSKRWIAWNILPIFDPVIFTTHMLAILLWALAGAQPAVVFPILYLFLTIYCLWRSWLHRTTWDQLLRLDKGAAEGAAHYHLIPTISTYDWHVLKEMNDGSYHVGSLKHGRLTWLDHVHCADHPAVEQSKTDPSIAAFLYFTSFACAQVIEHSWGVEVRWSDVRYRHRKQYPFVAVLLMDHKSHTLGSFVGWLSDDRLQKRLRMNTY
ncbi:metal-dependent hydrolase [Paenibacillus sp. 1P07SE]|uniref:metal-dependent hydrolase n=1 Tax=Paenibacillus sp. 1P07SE TaxID=3132209 RepID=UPI0039A67425